MTARCCIYVSRACCQENTAGAQSCGIVFVGRATRIAKHLKLRLGDKSIRMDRKFFQHGGIAIAYCYFQL
jgi:hypothetical protein